MGRLALRPALRNFAHPPAAAPAAAGLVNTYSVALDGTDDYVSSETIPHTELDAEVSWSVWAKVGTLDRAEIVAGLAYNVYATGGNAFKFLLKKSTSGGGKWELGQGNGWRTTQSIVIDSPIPTVGWHHIVFSDTSTSSSSGVCKVYIDGAEAHEFTSIQWSPPASWAEVFATAGIFRYSIYFDGNADEIAVWDRALSEAQVEEIFNGTPGTAGTGSPTDLSSMTGGGPLHWWRMGDEISGTTCPDQGSGTALDLELYSGAAIDADVPT